MEKRVDVTENVFVYTRQRARGDPEAGRAGYFKYLPTVYWTPQPL